MRRLALRWPGFDGQLENGRGWYTAELLIASDYLDQVVPLAFQLLRGRKSWHRSHVADLVEELAIRGYAGAKAAIYSAFSAEDEMRMSRAILSLDGIQGLEWILEQTPADVFERDPALIQSLVWRAEYGSGADAVEKWKQQRLQNDGRFKAMFEAADAERERRKRQPEPGRDTPFEVVRADYMGPGRRRFHFALWLGKARREDGHKAWEAFVEEEDPELLALYARGFARWPRYVDVPKAIELAKTWAGPRNPYLQSLKNVVDARLRDFGFDLIAKGEVEAGVELLAHNAVPEDTDSILAALPLARGEVTLHAIGCDLLELCDRLPDPRLLIWVYENGPCSFCRESALRRLIAIGEADRDLLMECTLDCVGDSRRMAEEALAGAADH